MRMQLKDILQHIYKIDPAECTVVSLGTDGLGEDARILEIVTYDLTAERPDQPIYVEGGDWAATVVYTGINRYVYDMEKKKASVAADILSKRLEGRTVVSHNALDFTAPALARLDHRFSFSRITYLDTLVLARNILGNSTKGTQLPRTVKEWQESMVPVSGRKATADYRLTNLCRFTRPGFSTEPEQAAIRTRTLFISLLGMEALVHPVS